MDLITFLWMTSRQHDSIIVVVDRLTKVPKFIPMKSTYSVRNIAQALIRDMVRLHGVPKKIISDRDAKLTFRLWKELYEGLGRDLAFSITYHLHIDGHIERVNKILEDMLRMYVMHQ